MGTARDAERAAAPAWERRGDARARRRWIALPLFAAILGGGAALGFVAYRLEVAAARRQLQEQMRAVGRLKAREISTWLQVQRAAAATAGFGPHFALQVERWLRAGRVPRADGEWLRGRLDRFRRSGDYVEVSILRPDGSVLVAAGDGAAHPVSADLTHQVMATERVLFTPIATSGSPEAARVHMDAVAPFTVVDASGSRTLGAMVFGIDPRRSLYPSVQWWPTESPSAESYLVVGDGAEVVYLNELRSLRGRASALRRPLSGSETVGARAVRGARGVVEGVDYRGEPVLAFVQAVEGSPWSLVSKVDQSEAYAPLRDYLWIYLAFVLGAALTAGLVARGWLHGVQREALRREHDATVEHVLALEASEAEREALIARLQKALDDVKTLRGIVPICASCKRIRDDAGYWKQVESYVSEHTEAQFSHGVCPECAKRLYPEYSLTPAPPAGDSAREAAPAPAKEPAEDPRRGPAKG